MVDAVPQENINQLERVIVSLPLEGQQELIGDENIQKFRAAGRNGRRALLYRLIESSPTMMKTMHSLLAQYPLTPGKSTEATHVMIPTTMSAASSPTVSTNFVPVSSNGTLLKAARSPYIRSVASQAQ